MVYIRKLVNTRSVATVCAFVFCSIGTISAAWPARENMVQTNYGYKTIYNQPMEYVYPSTSSKSKDWYVGAKLIGTFASWTNTYSNDYNTDVEEEKYANKPMIGGSIFLGNKISGNWRIEGELGTTGTFTDVEPMSGWDEIRWSLSALYLTFNAVYDTSTNNKGGFYIGAGLGPSFVTTKIEGAAFMPKGETEETTSPYGSLFLGYAFPLNSRISVDIGYKFSAFYGHKHSRYVDPSMYFAPSGTAPILFADETSMVMGHALSLGARYSF